jgi:cytochrome c551/c552
MDVLGGVGLVSAMVAASATHAGSVVLQPAMGDPLNGLTANQLAAFLAGKDRYVHTLQDEEGLGPVFNKESCGNCHANPVGGTGSQTVTRFGTIGKDGFDPLDDWGGSLLQVATISQDDSCLEEVPEFANVVEARVTNGIMGYGLVEAIPDSAIIAVRDAQPMAVQGEAHMVGLLEDPMGPLRIGRFGWKAQVATVLSFSGDASLNEMGLTNALVGQENDPNGLQPPSLAECDVVADPEDSILLGNGVDKTFVQAVTDFQRFLAAPPQTPRSGMSGEAVFMNLGCGACHHPQFTTADDPGLEDAIRNKTVRFYTDFLLHNMGVAGSVVVQGDAGQYEMKTAPLSGLRLRDPLWHDGTIGAGTFKTRVEAAIALHGAPLSTAAAAAQAYEDLVQQDPQAADDLILFLASLGRREFDVEEAGLDLVGTIDNVIDEFDFAGFGEANAFMSCVGPGPYTPDHPCAVHDVDQDGDVDGDDFDAFLLVYSGASDDCNDNQSTDLIDIFSGASADANNNAVPDECECLGSDTDSNGSIDVVDLVAVVLDWGCANPPGPCPGDVTNDGTVDVQDLVKVILDWGACP